MREHSNVFLTFLNTKGNTMDKSKNFFARKSAISKVAGMVTSALVDSRFDSGGAQIASHSGCIEAVTNAAMGSPLFEGLASDKGAVASISTSWSSAIKSHFDTYGTMPREEVLASCGESLMALCNGGEESSRFMFESLGGKANFATSAGIDIRAKTAALILPVALAAATSDAATFVQGGRDEVECFEIQRVSNSAFGDVAKGQAIDEFFSQQYSGMKQAYLLPTKPDGTKQRYVVYIYNEAAPAVDETALISVIANQNPQGCGYLANSITVMFNGRAVASSIDGSLFGQFSHNGEQHSIIPDGVADKDKGIIAFKVSPALPSTDAVLSVQYDVDIENGAGNAAFPEINHSMSSFKLRPHQSVLSAQHTIQSYWGMNREYGIDMRSMQTATQRNVMAYEKDIRNLRDMLMASSANPTLPINVAVAAGTYFKEKYEELHEQLLILSNLMMVETKVSGLVGLFAGIGASTIFKALGAPFFVPAPNYRQVPRIHFVGTLFGKWKIFECPSKITHAGQELGEMDALGYARGDDFSQAGLIVGDAVSPTLYKHGTDSRMFNRDTLWELSYGDISPRSGYKFFHKVTFTK
jgi:hypothetical protein